uniref:Uncharacterized protein n=1 Tax=Spongospora subterranea TaxID=70186 RepID=A0A0H5RA58_9EUKA|eukprot:CRZ11035.1 hypothetical protein [Spongospora subterranea]
MKKLAHDIGPSLRQVEVMCNWSAIQEERHMVLEKLRQCENIIDHVTSEIHIKERRWVEQDKQEAPVRKMNSDAMINERVLELGACRKIESRCRSAIAHQKLIFEQLDGSSTNGLEEEVVNWQKKLSEYEQGRKEAEECMKDKAGAEEIVMSQDTDKRRKMQVTHTTRHDKGWAWNGAHTWDLGDAGTGTDVIGGQGLG